MLPALWNTPAYSKKTVAQLIDSGNDYIINDYIITVKANQPKLFEHLHQQFEQQVPESVNTEMAQTRERQTQRTVNVLDTVDGIDPVWCGVQRLVRVERSGTQACKPYSETMFYLSSCLRRSRVC
ncbi:MAG: hypothetical protein WCA35_06590 [Kovacikia sp.]